MSISAIVIAKNAENIIERTLKSVQFADEVILVDIKSQDKTLDKAKRFTNKIYKFPKDSRFVEPVRNFALEKASKDWILVLDADEVISATLADKLKELSKEEKAEAYYLPRKNMVFSKWMKHTAWWPDFQLRFFKNGLVSWSDKIHSQPIYKGKMIKPEQLKKFSFPKGLSFLEAREDFAIVHHNYQSVEDYIDRLNRYTNIQAEQTDQKDFEISSVNLLASFKDDLFRRFFDKEGYKDGARGFYLSVVQAVYQMTVKMKTWDLLDNKEELEKDNKKELIESLKDFQKELDFWVRDLEIKEKQGFSKLIAILKRKFRL